MKYLWFLLLLKFCQTLSTYFFLCRPDSHFTQFRFSLKISTINSAYVSALSKPKSYIQSGEKQKTIHNYYRLIYNVYTDIFASFFVQHQWYFPERRGEMRSILFTERLFCKMQVGKFLYTFQGNANSKQKKVIAIIFSTSYITLQSSRLKYCKTENFCSVYFYLSLFL